MNRINEYCRNAVANHLMCKYIHLNSLIADAELMHQKSIREVQIRHAIRKTIRKGYKRADG